MDSIEGWTPKHPDNSSQINFISDNGRQNSSIRINYSLGAGKYVAIRKDLPFSKFNGIDKIRFFFKATGNRNSIELELDDNNGTYWGRKWVKATGAADWVSKEVEIKDIWFWAMRKEQLGKIVPIVG